MAVSGSDEQRHAAGSSPEWEEAWYFDFVTDDGGLAGAIRLALLPHAPAAWYWAHLAGRRRSLVAVRDHEVDIPRGLALEVRAPGLWADLVCETPMDHWTVGLEAFGVAFDDPAEALGRERGDPTALGFDLEWEAVTPPYEIPVAGGGRYEQPCRVHGDVLAGAERIHIDAAGHRNHSWGERRWWGGGGWQWVAGRLDDGTAMAAYAGECHAGFVTGPGGPSAVVEVVAENGMGGPPALGLATPAGVRVDDFHARAVPVLHAPVLVPSPSGKVSRLGRAVCAIEASDGRRGYGWMEQLRTSP